MFGRVERWNPMNKDAEKFFAEHPSEKYWYYSAGVRVPNPTLYRRPEWHSDPWPKDAAPTPRT